MNKSQIRYGVFCAVIVVWLSAFVNIFGQEFRGSITGSIKDPNGAVVPGATVIIKNIDTNVATTVKTNDDGNYTVPLLLPGRYSVSATGDGFKTSIRDNVTVNVDDKLTVDFQLEIGTAAEVNVVADTELLERGSVTTGTVVTQRQIEELPLSEGAAYNLATQSPGVSYTGNPQFTGPTSNGNLAAFRSNGVGSNQITLDGSPNLAFDGAVAYTPPSDAVTQFKIQTNSFDAQNGFTAGSTVNVAWDGALGEAIVIALDLAGVSVSTGAACTSGSIQPSPVLLALGLSRERAREGVRFSLGPATTDDEIDRVLAIVPAIVARARATSG